MNWLKALITKIFLEEKEKIITEREFKRNYAYFQELTQANNQILDLMAELELMKQENNPLNLILLRKKITLLLINTYKMIEALIKLSGEKYLSLRESFNLISKQIEEKLNPTFCLPEGPLIYHLQEIGLKEVLLAGNKMATLGEIRNKLKLNVPDGFVITTKACRQFIDFNHLVDEINRLLNIAEDLDDMEKLFKVSATIENLLLKSPLPSYLEKELKLAYEELKKRCGSLSYLAVRSSALGEDTEGSSFAGQYKSLLYITEDTLIEAFKEVLASKYAPQAILYRLQKGLSDEEMHMGIGCMVMIEAKVSGVIFTKSPQNPDSSFLEIYAGLGSAENIVQGKTSAEVYHIDRESGITLSAQFLDKERPLLGEGELRTLLENALKIEEYFGAPQDIEWCLDKDGIIWILQSRPLIFSKLNVTKESIKYDFPERDLLFSGGNLVHPGLASGQAHIVHRDLDMLSFPKGGILIVKEALPKWSSLLNKASALICEKGHPASHLAIVARELNVPSIFGAEGITELISSSENITVDAFNLKIYKGLHSYENTSLNSSYPSKNPIKLLFQEILNLVTPLNLTDPDSPKFKPDFCKTLHDLVRFCHEKAVDELIKLGVSLEKSRKAKRLSGLKSLNWWVIDLGGALKGDLEKKENRINLEDIESLPLKAIWEGFTAKPWDGPILDWRGLSSVFFSSTQRPELDPASPLYGENRNYILITPNFCHLGMKLGYHFTLIEAYLGEFTLENYIYFYFTGGGADEKRRLHRLELIARILEDYEFYVMIRGERLFAHLERKPKEVLIPKLKILGYLLLHTRQLDMIMENSKLVSEALEQIHNDLKRLI